MKTILIFSGGLDSTVLLYNYLYKGHTVKAISFDYGQRHSTELTHAKALCEALEVEHIIASTKELVPFFKSSSLVETQHTIPEGVYTETDIKTTVVPNRNMIFLSIAAAWAMSSQFDHVGYGAHASDQATYPDCRPEFADAMEAAIKLADWHTVLLDRPFINVSKADIVRLGAELKVPFEATWSCYKGGAIHCGRCGTCIQRRGAFHVSGVTDPTIYDSDAFSIETLIENNWLIHT